MFIYKITVDSKVYIGFDSKPEYKESRWKSHCKTACSNPKHKLHVAMKEHGIENCTYEVIARGFTKMVALALAEIDYIKQYDSYRNGLNSTPGGDGLGKYDLSTMTDCEIEKLKESLGEHWTKYNNLRWSSVPSEQRKQQVAHLHTKEVCEKRAQTLKKFYEANSEIRKEKAIGIKKWQLENGDKFRAINKQNGLIGSAKVSKKVIVQSKDGTTSVFSSRSDFQRKTGLWFSTLVAKSKQDLYYKGYILKDINE